MSTPLRAFQPPPIPDQRGRTVVITGATSGLGLVAARRLSAAGARVIVGVRNPAKAARLFDNADTATEAGAPIDAATAGTAPSSADSSARAAAAVDPAAFDPSPTSLTSRAADAARRAVEIRPLDTASLASIAAFANSLLADGIRLDALINNAGVSMPRFERSVDGTELTWATNVVGPAALTARLLPAMTSPGARIVLVGSNLSQRSSRIPDLSRVDDPGAFSQLGTYRDSKMAAAAWAVDLADRLGEAGSGTRSVIAHPGVANTAMNRQATTPTKRLATALVARLVARDVDDAVRSILWSATADDVPQRAFIGPALRRGDHRLHIVPVRGAAADAGFRAAVRGLLRSRAALPHA